MRSLRFCFVSGLLLAGSAILHAQSPAPQPATLPTTSAVRQLGDIPYVIDGHKHQQLDLFLPAADGPARPLVVTVHGGGWSGGSRKEYYALGIALVNKGYVVASIDYRLSQDAIYPAQIEDCKAAIRFLRAHASEYGIAPNRVGAWGQSAGGHLVALLGTTGDIRDFDTGANLDQSSKVQCIVDWYGPTDFLHFGEPPLPIVNNPNNAGSRLINGMAGAVAPEKARRASPVYFVNKNSSPFLIMHGDKDNTVPLQQSQILEAALKKSGSECALMVLSGAGHGGPAFKSPEATAAVLQFLDRHLKP